jgi:hypothetical protein
LRRTCIMRKSLVAQPFSLVRATLVPVFLAAGSGLIAARAQLPAKPSGDTAAATAAASAAPAAAAVAAPPAPAVAASAAAPGNFAAAVAAAASGARPGAAITPPGSPPPFATVIKDARRIDGPLTFWQKEDKVWIELMPANFGQPFILSPKIKSGISDAWVLGGLMGMPINGAGGVQIVEFVRVHNQVRLQARNTDVVATAGSPEARALADTYSNSLLGATPVVSGPHPDRKSVLIDASSLFLNDIMGIGMMLQRNLRQGYGLDRGNSLITTVRASPQASIIETQSHFFSSSVGMAMPSLFPGLSLPGPTLPRYLPDTRSMLVSLHYSLAPLPETPMPTRRADPRIGTFTSTVLDFSSDMQLSPRQRYVNRWRLEKKDPAAAMSEPVKPIAFTIDRNVPAAYRETVRAAILEWNKAFEKIGISGAITVEQQADDAKTDTLDFGQASVRWMMNADPVFAAIGPSHVDPRTGEILDSVIAFEGMAARSQRGLRAQVLAPGQTASAANSANSAYAASASNSPAQAAAPFELFPMKPPAEDAAKSYAMCQFADLAAEQLGYALDVLEARGELDPDSPMTQQFVQDYVKDSIMHEVGHALGLRHNFRASRAYTEAQLADAEFTRSYGTTGSVMEYNAVNLPLPGKTGGVPFQTTLGPYDYWAIEYAYKPMAAGTTPEAEKAELQRIASRSNEPLLAFGTDEDIFFGLDPETIQLDLGNDPMAFAAKRLAIAKDLFQRQEKRELPPTRDYAVLRRSLGFALADVTRAMGVLARQIGGVRTLRDFPGSGRDPLQPVSAKVQREALDLMARSTLSPEGLKITPALQRRLAPDYLDRAEAAGGPTDFAVPQRLFQLQRAVLNYLMSDFVAARLLDNTQKLDRADQAFQLNEVYQRVFDDVWGELKTGAEIASARRDLQREHVNRLAFALMSPSARTDVRGVMRAQTTALLKQLEAAKALASRRKAGAGDATLLHLNDSLDTLRHAQNAQLPRLAL